MTTSTNVLTSIQANYNSALQNEPTDLAAAASEAQVMAIQANIATAGSLYYQAAATALTTGTSAVDTAYQQAQAAQAAVATARSQSAAIADLLNKLNQSTTAAQNLFDLAKS
ncbi:hypothetical protein [Chromobacterium violaceum]|uniref:hypothetical protein n=1 Tax=Chromobacterium violaceum TaxID=536 RepID=UPI001CE06A31|nr:hypothetical protein [Chromobacterium violaceum]